MAVLPGYRLALTFRDGRRGIIDCSNITAAKSPGIFAPLADPEFFARATLELGAPTWPNGADLDPNWLHQLLAGQETASVPF